MEIETTDPLKERIIKLSPKPGDFLIVRVESDAEAEHWAEGFQRMYADGSLSPLVNLMILPVNTTIELLSDEQLDAYGLERTELFEDETEHSGQEELPHGSSTSANI